MPLRRRSARLAVAGALGLAIVFSAACQKPQPAAKKPPEPRFSTHTQEFRRQLDGCGASDQTEAPCATFVLSWPEFTKVPNEAVREKLNATIREWARKNGQEPETEAEELFEQCAQFREHFPARSVPYFVRRTAAIQFEGDRLLSLVSDDEQFRGGPFPVSHRRYLNLDGRTGAVVELDSLLAAGAMPKLLAAVEARFREQHGLAPDDSLARAGFRFPDHRFALSHEWGIAPRGLLFHYNCLEIAPQATGATDILVPWEGLADVVNQQTGLQPQKR